MLLFPNCKINIGLRVVRKREDGYHDLETIFYPVYGLHDELEVEPAEEFAFLQDGLVVDCLPTDNLICKVYKRMQEHFPQIGNVKITFKKNIPFGAGLGGGSSDAAHMAIALNQLFHLGLTQQQLAAEVRPLGADCPFFVYNTPCYAEGIGDELTPISLDLSGLRLVMIKPNCSVSTKEAYAGIIRHPEVEGQIKTALTEGFSFDAMRPLLINDFEQTVFPHHPEIPQIKQHLLSAGAVYAAMSGSGSTVFGLFKNMPATHSAAQWLHNEFGEMLIFDNMLV